MQGGYTGLETSVLPVVGRVPSSLGLTQGLLDSREHGLRHSQYGRLQSGSDAEALRSLAGGPGRVGGLGNDLELQVSDCKGDRKCRSAVTETQAGTMGTLLAIMKVRRLFFFRKKIVGASVIP